MYGQRAGRGLVLAFCAVGGCLLFALLFLGLGGGLAARGYSKDPMIIVFLCGGGVAAVCGVGWCLFLCVYVATGHRRTPCDNIPTQ